MKRLMLVATSVCFVAIICIGVALFLPGSQAATTPSSPRPEFRAAWITAWSKGFLTPEEADETIKAAKEANLNALFIEVRKTADAFYNSTIEPRGTELASAPADYDPLAYVIEKAHAQGIEVHAWAVIFRVWSGRTKPANPAHVCNAHPEWLSETFSGQQATREGYWLDPGNLEARGYTVGVLRDIASRYDVDGIHLDYIRYAGRDWGYNSESLRRFYAETGRSERPAPDDPVWSEWRRKQVTETVRSIYRELTAIRPELKITASTIPWGSCPSRFEETSAYRSVFQDWRAWMKEGIIDANVLMNYKNENSPSQASAFRGWIEGASRWRYGRHVYMGQNFDSDIEGVVQQILASRKRRMDGISGFAFNDRPSREKLVAALRSRVFQQAVAVPEMPWKLDAVRKASREIFARAVSVAVRDENLDEAIKLLKRAVELDPKYAEAHFRLGRCYLRKGQFREAADSFKETLRLNPRHRAARDQLKVAEAKVSGAGG